MSLISPTYVFDGAPASISNVRTPDEVLQRLYASTLWLGESHTSMLAFLASFLPPDSLGGSMVGFLQRVRIKEDEATVRSSVTYTKQLKPLFSLLKTVEELRNRHQPRPVVRQESTSAAAVEVPAGNPNGLTDIDREVLATLCSSSHPCYNPPLDRRRQYHAREVQLQIVLVLFLLGYMTRHPPPSGVVAFLPVAAPLLPMMRPFGMMGGRSASMPSTTASSKSAAKQDVLTLNKRFEALVEQLSVLQLRAVVPELQVGNHGPDAKSRIQPLYARPEANGTTAAEVTPSKLQLHVPPEPIPKLFKLENLMATFYKPILEPLFADSLPQQLAQFQDRCGDIDVTDTVWASDPENSPLPNRTAPPVSDWISESQMRDDDDDDEATQPPPPPAPQNPFATKATTKKPRNIPLGTPDLAPEKKARKHPPLLTKMIGGGREISMDSRSFTRCSSAGPGSGLLMSMESQGGKSGVGSMLGGPLLLTTTTTTTTTMVGVGASMGPPSSGGQGCAEEMSQQTDASQDRMASSRSPSLPTSQLPNPSASQSQSQSQSQVHPATATRENPFKVGPFSSAAKRKFPFSSAAAGGGLKRVNSVEPGPVKKEG
ncbi:hypothetical protein A4X13_0g1370 [Tilletia indica]|uniref:Uncharacterized protein n=1 Tax=Tilletia indica TaxID=43049 RepID=A0A177TVM2_9BASI|nr:hypothetical protein A4X13_0g1370 [Tilletia indica]